MSVDKKVLDGKLRLVLLNAIGSACVTDEFDMEKLHETLENYGQLTH
jgi:3-dehydroquinate synthase